MYLTTINEREQGTYVGKFGRRFKKGIYDIIILISKLKEEMKKGKLL